MIVLYRTNSPEGLRDLMLRYPERRIDDCRQQEVVQIDGRQIVGNA